MKTTLFSVVFLLCTLHPTQSLSQDILWEKSYGGLHAEYLFDAQPTFDYGFILVGSSLSKKSGNKTQDNVKDLDYWIWKMDERGDLEWQLNYGGEGSDMLISVQCTREGGYILAGTSDSPKGSYKREDGRGQEDLWIVKLKPDGSEQWQRTIGGSGKDIVSRIAETPDGYIIGGSSSSSPPPTPPRGGGEPQPEKRSPHYGNMDYWVVKLDNNGEIEWEKTYGGRYRDVLESMDVTKDGGYIIGGYSNSPVSDTKSEDPVGEGDYWILKLDKSGTIEWQRTLGGEGDDRLYAIKQTEDEGYIVGGSSASGVGGSKTTGNPSTSSGQAGTDFWILKLDQYGETVWQQTYDFGETDVLTSLVENADGSFLIGGYAQSETVGQKRNDKKGINDYIALKIDAEGEEKWRTSVGSSGEDVLRKLTETRDGGYLLAGTSRGEVSGDKNSGQGRADFWVVKLRDKDKEDKMRNPGLEAYPNPAVTFTNIIVNHDFESGSASVYDIGGRQLQHFKISSRTVPVSVQGYPEGVYIVKIATNVKTEAVKILKGINRD